MTDNRHGLVVNACVTQADGQAEKEGAKAMTNEARQACENYKGSITLGADKGHDARELIEALPAMNVLPPFNKCV